MRTMNLFNKFKNLDANSRIVLKNTAFAVLIKGGSLGLSLLTTPAFVRYFGNNTVLGVWYTLLSVLTWFLNFDLGIGNGIRNHLAKDLVRGDRISARKTISSGLFANGAVAMVLSLVGIFVIMSADLNSVYNVETTVISAEVLRKATLMVFVGIMLRFFLTGISAVFYALQESSVNSFLALCVSLMQLGFVLLTKPADPEQGLLMLSTAYMLIANLPMMVAAVVIFSSKLRDCRPAVGFVDRVHIRKVMGIGTVFFVCQITYMLLVNTNEFLISRLFGPQYTTEYTFYYKLTGLISMLISLALTPMWSAITKAMEENNYSWVNKLYRKLKCIGLLSAVFQFLFILVQQFVMDLWLGESSIRIDYWIALAFACFGSTFTYSSVLSTIVCGMARMKLQMVCYTVGAVAKFGSVLLLAQILETWSVVVWVNAAVLLVYCTVQQIDLDKYMKTLAKK